MGNPSNFLPFIYIKQHIKISTFYIVSIEKLCITVTLLATVWASLGEINVTKAKPRFCSVKLCAHERDLKKILQDLQFIILSG